MGLSPWSNPAANPVLMLAFQTGMFAFWATVATVPRVFLDQSAMPATPDGASCGSSSPTSRLFTALGYRSQSFRDLVFDMTGVSGIGRA